MSTLTVAALRARIAAALSALPDWKESGYPPGLFGRDTSALLPLAFAIDVEETGLHPQAGRQKRSEGALVLTVVTVRWAHRLRGDAAVSDFDTALGVEATAVATVLGASQADLLVTYLGALRDTSQENWLIGAVRFRAMHRLPLA